MCVFSKGKYLILKQKNEVFLPNKPTQNKANHSKRMIRFIEYMLMIKTLVVETSA